MKLTQKLLLKLPRPAKGNKLYFDEEARGMAVRVTANGVVAFILCYRIRGRERRYTIGQLDDLTLADARKEAEDLRREIRDGRDPLEKRTNDREAPTMKDLATDYFTLYADKFKRASSLRNDHGMIDSIITPKLGKLAVSGVTNRDVESLHASLQGTPYRANRVLALLSKMFSLAMKWHAENPTWRADNPAKGIKKFPEEKRERWLDKKEMERLSAALAKHADQGACDAIRLILLTGSRKSEVLKATWDQFDLKGGVWTKPSAHTKQKKVEHVPLSKEALTVLSRLKRDPECEFLFPGRVKGQALENVKRVWSELRTAAKLENIRVHDLRHCFASTLVSSGVPIAIVGKLLGHTQMATTERYSHLAASPLREAANRYGKYVEARAKAAARG